MNRPIYKLPAAVIPAAMMILLSGCTGTGLPFIKREKTVGTDIAIDDITGLYWTYATSSFPPEYQRYYFHTEDGTFWFYHETREGERFPLQEEDITVSGTLELTAEEWNTFFDYLNNGIVRSREENIDSGDSGPWTYLYWKNDKGDIQQFSFESYKKASDFEAFCKELKAKAG
jgi:hypothetical protein